MSNRTDFQAKIIAIIGGTGAQGGGLALRWARAGHRVIVASRDPAKAERAVAEMTSFVPQGSLSNAGYAEAAFQGDIVVLAVPYAAQRASVEEIGEAIAGKILVDATVPLRPPKVARVQLPPGGSAVLALQEVAPASTRIVSAFQNVSASHLQDVEHELDCDVLVAGDDPDAREVVIGLSRDIGMRAWHAGPLCNSAAAEALTSVLIAINSRYKVPGAGIRITGIPDA
ncbi:NADPH-dependent F420 reductase [Variovorax sp. LjRoot178]|uniref:NADPH-dependent F420 reductase n=1 Tax=Variovorax sp. LjRoot178 TaxID=3342277 RepID=UPI003ECF55AB